jgi:WD40 repeat protein
MIEYHDILASYYENKPLYIVEGSSLESNIRKVAELPWQQTKAEKWDCVTDTLCNLDFIQAKASAKMTYDLVNDFNVVLKVIPDNAENNKQKNARQMRLMKYADDLIACTRGEIARFDLEIPESITPMTEKQTNIEFNRIKSNPSYSERLKDYLSFLGKESSNLQNYAKEVPNFATQQAWNFSIDGPVGIAAEYYPGDVYKSLFLRIPSSRPEWNPRPQVLKIFHGHTHFIKTVELIFNGRKAFSISDDNICILWDLDTGEIVYKLDKPKRSVSFSKINPIGKEALIRYYDNSIDLLDLSTGIIIKEFNKFKSSSELFAIDNEKGIAFSGSEEGSIIISNLNTGLELTRLLGHSKIISPIAFTPDGSMALSGANDNTCILWDLALGKAVRKLIGHNFTINSVAMTPDGKWAISSGYWDGNCIFWNLTTGEQLYTLKNNSKVLALAITPDGKLALAGYKDSTCILWDLNTGQPINRLYGHKKWVSAISISPDGSTALSGSYDKTCIFWDLHPRNNLKNKISHTDSVYQVIETSGKEMAIFGYGDRILIWDQNTGEAFKTLLDKNLSATEVVITSDRSKLISRVMGNICIIWDLKTEHDLLPPEVEPICSEEPINIPLDLKGLSKSSERMCNIRDFAFGQILQKLNRLTSYILSIVISPDGNRALSISKNNNNCLIIWNPKKVNVIETLTGHTDWIDTVEITPDGKKALSGSRDRTCILWDIITCQAIKTLRGHSDDVSTIAITPDGKLALSGSRDSTSILWDLNTGKAIKLFNGHKSPVISVSITPDGKMALNGYRDGTYIRWKILTGEIINTLNLTGASNANITITSDGLRAFLISDEQTCILWDFILDKQIGRATVNSTIISVSLFSRGIILCCRNGEVILLEADKSLMCAGIPIITARQIWDHEMQKFQELKAQCPLCGFNFTPPVSVFVTIKRINEKLGLQPEQSPCLELPEEVWRDPGLLTTCPHCSEKLKFNPFIV